LDLSVPQLMDHTNLIWIDHHKTAIDRYPASIPGYRIDGVAACRLTWQWFLLHSEWDPREQHPPYDLPAKHAFIERLVPEPYAVRLAGEYDIWDKRDDNADLFQYGLRSQYLTPDDWDALLNPGQGEEGLPYRLLNQGRAVKYAKEQENKSIITRSGYDVTFEGLTFLACNHAMFNSHLFTGGVKDHHDALLGWRFDGKKFIMSLYHAPGKEHHDLSEIAKKYGGGGHRGACGFTHSHLPF
jgi:oligoribonuclease NrnB/cAMP/cGMP phosphodiesterase (DHH superfamily)